MFLKMQETIKEDFARYMFHVQAVDEDERQQPTRMREERRQIPMAQQLRCPPEGGRGQRRRTARRSADVAAGHCDKIPRNAPCPCGSGKKYKQCHGRPGAEPLDV